MTCTICQQEIPPARLEVAPATLTCSRDCSIENARRVRSDAAKRWRVNAKVSKKKGGRRG